MDPINFRQTIGTANAVIGQLLMDHGAACVLDILHVYTVRLHQTLNVPLPLPKGAAIEGMDVHVIMQAWSNIDTEGDNTRTSPKRIPSFNENEMAFVSSLLHAVDVFCQCSSERSTKDIEKETNEAIEKFEKQDVDIEYVQNKSPKKGKKGDKLKDNKLKNSMTSVSKFRKCPCCQAKHVPVDPKTDKNMMKISIKGQEFENSLNKMLGSVRRQLRMALYEGGVLEAAGPWLIGHDSQLKVTPQKYHKGTHSYQ